MLRNSGSRIGTCLPPLSADLVCYHKNHTNALTIKFFTVLGAMDAVFRGDAWFLSLEASDARRLLECAREKTLRRSEVLYWRGGSLSKNEASFYGLAEGTLKASAHAMDGRETILRIVPPGSWFGELSAIDGLPRDYSMTAETDVRLLEVPRDDFLDLMQEASFANAIVRLMGQRLRMFYATFEHVVSSPPLTKVAHRLFFIANHGRASGNDTPSSSIKVSQESLCMMLGLSRPTLIRALKTLEASEIIMQKYGEIIILDMAALRRQALHVQS